MGYVGPTRSASFRTDVNNVLILVANSEIRSIDRQQVLETPGCQLGQHSENEFATSINERVTRDHKRVSRGNRGS